MSPPDAEAAEEHDEEEGMPGTFVLMMLFLALIAGMWLLMYFTLLSRS